MNMAGGNLTLQDPVRYVKGVGPKRAAFFQELGVIRVIDLLEYYPFRLLDFSRVCNIGAVIPGDDVTVQGKVVSREMVTTMRGPAARVGVSDGTGVAYLVWYNMPYMLRQFRPGQVVVASGKAEYRRSSVEIAHPLWKPVDKREVIHGPIVPVYHASRNLPSQTIHSIIRNSLPSLLPHVCPVLPRAALRDFSRMDEIEAFKLVHAPADSASWHEARRVLALREVFLLQLALLLMKRQSLLLRGPGPFSDFSLAERFLSGLPFDLTPGQRKAIDDVKKDFTCDTAMNRLLQGDVGSGKTIVAMYALIAAASNGFQGAFLVPTEVLAEQHFKNFVKLAGDFVQVSLLSGSVSALERRKILDDLRRGRIQVLVGTHAMLEPDVEWHRLGLVVTDEQHRFGVRQRLRLPEGMQSYSPHVLVMSATPIPRSLALTLYGDLDITILDTMPPGRKTPKTSVLSPEQRSLAYKKVREEVEKGHQAYVVCPAIREGRSSRKAAELVYTELQSGYLRGLRLDLIHGDMPRHKVQATMQSFVDGQIDVLVATTVIEVGIDVANATCMVVEDADVFGLATLHQLRGRVGRSEHQSYCFLLSSGNSPSGLQRLKVLENTSDGFAIAEADLHLRGPGEFFGTKQHGLPETRIADLDVTLDIVSLAREMAREIAREMPQWSDRMDLGRQPVMDTLMLKYGNIVAFSRSR